MAKEHIDMVSGVHNSVAVTAMSAIPSDVDFGPVKDALKESQYHLMQSRLSLNDGGVQSAMHLHDSVRSLGKVLHIMSVHAPDSSYTLSAFRDLKVAAEMAARHEQGYFSKTQGATNGA